MMRKRIKQTYFATLLPLAFFVAGGSVADSIDSTRTSACDWECQSDAGETLSCHQRQDTAFESCINRALSDGLVYRVVGGTYRVTATVDVETPGGSAALTWTAPSENTNGSPLTDLAGYRIYYGQSPAAYTNSVEINDPATNSYVVDNLAAGTWYFAATAFNHAGIESSASNVATKAVE